MCPCLLRSKSIWIYHQFISLLETIYKTYYAFSIKKIIYVTECYYGLQEIYSPILTQGKHEDSVSIYIYIYISWCRIERHIVVTLEAKMNGNINSWNYLPQAKFQSISQQPLVQQNLVFGFVRHSLIIF